MMGFQVSTGEACPLQRISSNLYMKFGHLSFLRTCISFAFLDPDSKTQLNPEVILIRIQSRSSPDLVQI
jgi:hypothetical protein